MSAFRHATTLNIVGVIVLFVGLGGAGLVYWLGQNRAAPSTTNGDWQDGTLSLTDSKISTRDIELYGGKLEVVMVKFLDWLQHPSSLAIVIAVISVLIAVGCFLLARSVPPD
jgi:hypothetical protein